MQVYTFVNHRGRAGYNVCVWGGGWSRSCSSTSARSAPRPTSTTGIWPGLSVRQPELRRTASVRFERDDVALGVRVRGAARGVQLPPEPGRAAVLVRARTASSRRAACAACWRCAGGRIEFDRIAHRDHSWGTRDWGAPQHWKWLLAHTPSGPRAERVRLDRARRVGLQRLRAARRRAGRDRRASTSTRSTTPTWTSGGSRRRWSSSTVPRPSSSLESFGVVRMPHDDPFGTVIIEAACRATIDGEAGGGQFETHWPLRYIDHLAGGMSEPTLGLDARDARARCEPSSPRAAS